MNIGFVKKTIMALMVSLFLGYVLITTNDLLTRIVVIPFLIFGISLFIKNICLIFKKKKATKIFNTINVIAFFIYYFGFLVCWDYVAIRNKEYMAIVFSLLAWFGGIFVAYRRYLKLRNVDKTER